MSLLRAFIAIEIPPQIQHALDQQTAKLRQSFGRSVVRWVPPKNTHLTLKFLGDISPANLDLFSQMLGTEASQYQPFTIRIGGLGVFPNLRRPRVIWIGVEAPAALERLQRGIEATAARLGYESEKRPFSPHLTIGRINQRISGAERQQIRTALENTKIGLLGEAQVEAVHLFRSDLKPSGAEYTCLFTAPLGATQHTRGDI